MNTHEFTPIFTDTNEIVDDTTLDTNPEDASNEYEYDMDSVRGLLEALSAKFKILKAVRPTCAEVESLLLVTGHNSWSDFQRQFKDELNEYFDPTPGTEQPNVDKSLLVRAEARRDQTMERIKAQEELIKKYKAQKAQLTKKLEQTELDALSAEGMEWDKEAHTKHIAASKLIVQLKHSLKQMEAKNPETLLKQLYINLRYHEGAVRFAEQAIQGNYRILINTGNPKEDARLYQKVGESVVWELNRLFEKEETIEKRMAEERYSGADMGVARLDGYDLTTMSAGANTGGGVYRSPIENLHEVRDAMEEQFATYASCQMGYEIAACAFVPKYDNEWFPVWMELSQALVNAKQRSRQAQINRARSQLESYKELIKR